MLFFDIWELIMDFFHSNYKSNLLLRTLHLMYVLYSCSECTNTSVAKKCTCLVMGILIFKCVFLFCIHVL